MVTTKVLCWNRRRSQVIQAVDLFGMVNENVTFWKGESWPKNVWGDKFRSLLESPGMFLFSSLPSWWFQPLWKILVKMGIFPNFRVFFFWFLSFGSVDALGHWITLVAQSLSYLYLYSATPWSLCRMVPPSACTDLGVVPREIALGLPSWTTSVLYMPSLLRGWKGTLWELLWHSSRLASPFLQEVVEGIVLKMGCIVNTA